ncbi:glycoside hydrolase family 18 protein [Roridomyces roridus]|uniref:Glycoside hydrolase family 18 protein n=1 Tax=Roridomyces roridus TaxID=1738132 RepID=A0AAD7B893_9AGAR|nr:glycoside hydrolase family 18 protein [Roridomyces roridus]
MHASLQFRYRKLDYLELQKGRLRFWSLTPAMAQLHPLAFILSALLALLVVEAVPFNSTDAAGLSPIARDFILSSRAVPTSPVWVAYFDQYISWDSLPAASSVEGFSVFALAFIYSNTLEDNAVVWATIDNDTRASIKAEYAAAGISLIVSAYGGTVSPTSDGDDPVAAANYIANFVKTYDLNGVDVDYEDFGALETAGTAVAWLTTFTKTLRGLLPQGQYILTHAPVAPWFSPNLWPDNGYLGVHAAVGSLIDWYNVQFYNQGTSEYTTCTGLINSSSSKWPNSALFQIAASGVPLNKLVIGKPAASSDASNGFMDTATLATCLGQAKALGWSAGAMTWEYPDATSAWIAAVRADSWPVGSSVPPPISTTTSSKSTTSTTTTTSRTTTTSTSTSTKTTTSPSKTSTKTSSSSTTSTTTTGANGSCSGASVWTASAVYTSGNVVTYNGALWTANQWNEDEAPGGDSGAWDRTSTCNAGLVPATAAPKA